MGMLYVHSDASIFAGDTSGPMPQELGRGVMEHHGEHLSVQA